MKQSTQMEKRNDPNVNFGMYEADRVAKSKAQPSLPTVTGEVNVPRVISDREVLHRASSEVWPRVTRVQTIEFLGKTSEVNFWHNANGSLHHVA